MHRIYTTILHNTTYYFLSFCLDFIEKYIVSFFILYSNKTIAFMSNKSQLYFFILAMFSIISSFSLLIILKKAVLTMKLQYKEQHVFFTILLSNTEV